MSYARLLGGSMVEVVVIGGCARTLGLFWFARFVALDLMMVKSETCVRRQHPLILPF